MVRARLDLIRAEHVRLGPQGPELYGAAAAAVQAFSLIERVEFGPPRGRREYQQDRIATILAQARTHSPFWAARIRPGRGTLDRLPILTRAALRSQAEDEGPLPVPAEHGEVRDNATAGATSQPLRIFVTALNGAYNEARYAFDDVAMGRDLSLPLTVMHKRFAARHSFDRWPSLTGEIWRTGPGVGLPLGLPLEEMAESLFTGALGHLMTRPASLRALVALADATGRRPGRVGDILTIGETVAPELRARTRAVLGARIADRYSCEEVGPIAFQCPTLDTHYHVTSSNVVLEAVDDRGQSMPDGKPGSLLVTGLGAEASPVLRYELGDIGCVLPRCPCGHAGQALADLQGRRKSLLRLPDGRRRYYHLETSRLLAIAPVREFRILQPDRHGLVLECAADRPLTGAECDALGALLRAELAADLAVRVAQVERIDWGPSGKRITVWNLIDDPPE